MKRKLLGHKLGNQVVGVDLTSWSANQINNEKSFISVSIEDNTPSGYTNITSIKNWKQFGLECVNDYLVFQREIKSIVIASGWTNLTSEEKDIAIEYFAFDDSGDAMIYLMTEKGMSQENAMMFIVKHWHIHHGKMILCTKERWFQVKLIVGMFISTADAEDLFNTAKMLIYGYTESGIIGKNYGDNTDGIMDFIESTNGYVNNGLIEKNYNLNFGNWFYFIQGIKNVLVYGIYDK